MKNDINDSWKKVKFDFEFTNDYKLEVSDLGQLRATSRLARKRILKGSLINNYKVAILKFYKPRTNKKETELQLMKKQLSMIMTKLSPLKQKVKTRVHHDKTYINYKKEVGELQELYNGLQKVYRKKFDADLKLRTINCTLLVHRLVAEYFCYKPSEEHNQVTHLDYNRRNNRATNLKWVTQNELNIHQQKSPRVKAAKGINKGKRFEHSKHYKLTTSKVMLIKKRINQGKSLRTLAKQFNVTETQMLRIKRGINWGSVEAAF